MSKRTLIILDELSGVYRIQEQDALESFSPFAFAISEPMYQLMLNSLGVTGAQLAPTLDIVTGLPSGTFVDERGQTPTNVEVPNKQVKRYDFRVSNDGKLDISVSEVLANAKRYTGVYNSTLTADNWEMLKGAAGASSDEEMLTWIAQALGVSEYPTKLPTIDGLDDEVIE